MVEKSYVYPGSLVADVKVKSCTKMNRTLESLFIQKKTIVTNINTNGLSSTKNQ